MKNKLNGNELKAIGFKEGRILGLALDLVKNYKKVPKEEVLALLKKVRDYPESFLDDEVLKTLANAMISETLILPDDTISLKKESGEYTIYGTEYIESGATAQMDIAMKLPVTVGGALMPDAHQGYGLPIGGVLATKNAIIPYGVGVDIGCRMALSVYDIPENYLFENLSKYKRELVAHTKFGAGQNYTGNQRSNHKVLDDPKFNMNALTRQLHEKAWAQLGTSGGGNHFAEWGIVELPEDDRILNVPKGKYLGLLTHSGSRGFGATIAGHYTKLAKDLCKLPKEAANLAYLDLRTEAGEEYWLAMNLAGDYASACHEVIHNKLSTAIGGQLIARIENHHNFAWKENWNGEEVLVHRKGATPAGEGVMGIIPGSMATPGFVVRGRGVMASLNSASHGAGRKMSRTQAIKGITHNELKTVLKEKNVTLIGAGLDEAPMAYKDINQVMAAQKELVDIVAKFTPVIVRMADDGSRED